ncbi:MAG: hypothetical protein IJB44_07325 [Clostridia bacterium]|nr:hypothetical protein [Clostridia bacterium]
MGKLSFSDMLVRIAKILLAYYYVCPMLFILLFGAIFDFLLNVIEYFDIVSMRESTRFFIEMFLQIPLAFVFAVLQSIRDGYRDSFYGRYSLKTYSLIAFGSAVVCFFADPIVKAIKPKFNVCPVGHVFLKLGLPYTLCSAIFFATLCGLIILFYFIGRRRALYENAEAIYKIEKSVAEEEAKKKVEKSPYTVPSSSQPVQRKTGTWRDSVRTDQ